MRQSLVLEVRDLKTYLFTRTGVVKAVDGVSFDLHAGETLGIVGESGSGKTMTALSLIGLVPQPAGRIVGGEIILQGEDLLLKSQREMQEMRGRKICMIPQDPMTSLNPVYTIGNQIFESVRRNEIPAGGGVFARSVELLEKVKIAAPAARLGLYPHQMSGGMRQRVVGAIAIAGSPAVLIADEPTTSLDATIQYQYLLLLKEIQAATGVAIIFITHDFGIVAKLCHRVAVMYAGKIVETADVNTLFERPAHPYTQALLRSIADLDDDVVGELYSIEGEPPALDDLPRGCSFAPRCPFVFDKCEQYPPQVAVGDRHAAACWKPL